MSFAQFSVETLSLSCLSLCPLQTSRADPGLLKVSATCLLVHVGCCVLRGAFCACVDLAATEKVTPPCGPGGCALPPSSSSLVGSPIALGLLVTGEQS